VRLEELENKKGAKNGNNGLGFGRGGGHKKWIPNQIWREKKKV
jgi:hypothetical protein